MSFLNIIYISIFFYGKTLFLLRKKHKPEQKIVTRSHPTTSQKLLHHPHRKTPQLPTRAILRARSHLRCHRVPVRSPKVSQIKTKMPHWSARPNTAHTNPRMATTMTIIYHNHRHPVTTQTLPQGLARPMQQSHMAPVLTVM